MSVENNENQNTPNPDNSPNEDWQNDPRLDENGNPKEETPQPDIKPSGEETPPEGGEKPKDDETPNEDNKDEPEVDKAAVFDTTAAQQVESFLTDAGLEPSDVARAVTENGGEVTPAILKALVEKHGEGVASLIKDKLTYLHESNVKASQAKDQAVFAQVEKAFEGVTEQSGEDSFKELATWAKANMTKEERASINELLAKGGASATIAVDTLVNRFKQSDSFVEQKADLLVADDASQEYGGKPLDKAGYDRELRKLMNEGHDYDTSPEIAQLNARRMKAIRRGQR